jgi:hypothetical protein
MAEQKAKLKKTRKRSIANPTRVPKAGSKPSVERKRKRAEKSALDKVYEALDLSGPDDTDANGAEKLCTSVDRVIAKRSVEIAKKLAQRTEEGNVTSAKLLLNLVSQKKQPRKPKEPFSKALLEVVQKLECEPEWTSPQTPENGQTTDPKIRQLPPDVHV